MTLTFRSALLASALGLAAVLPARADVYATRLGDVADAVQTRNAALPEVLTPTQKKEKAAYAKVIKAMVEAPMGLADDLKHGGKCAKALEKGLPEDEQFQGLLDALADAFGDDVSQAIMDLADEVALKPDSKAKIHAGTLLDQGVVLVDQASAAAPASARLKLLGKALAKTKAAVKFLAGAGGGGGGGGGGGAGCYDGSRTLLAGENCGATWSGGSFTATSVIVSVQTSPSPMTSVSYYQCGASLDQQFRIFWYFTPVVGTPYNYNSMSGFGVDYGAGSPGGMMQIFSGSGTLTFTEVDVAAGTYAGTFSFTNVTSGVTVTDGTFRITGAK